MSRRRDNLTGFLRGPSMEMDEMIPVDNFFDDYLATLRSPYYEEDKARVSHAIEGFHNESRDGIKPPFATVGSFDRGGIEDTQQSVFVPVPVSHQLQESFPVSNPPMQQQDNFFTDPGYYNEAMLDRNHNVYSESSADNAVSSEMKAEVQPHNQLTEPYYHQAVDTNRTHRGTTVGGGISKPKQKSERQQQLNKLAQQRYRERKKAKAAGLERQVEILSDQLNQLSAIREEKLNLEERNLNLERKLLEREAEVSSLKTQLEEAKKAPGGNTSSDMTAYHQEERPKIVGTDSKVAMMFHKKVQDLRAYLEKNGLDQSLLSNPLDANIEKHHVDAIHTLVGDVCMVCMQLSRHDGPNLWDLISANLDSKKRESHDRSVWRKIAEDLKLNGNQIMTAFRLREQHLMKLETIYVQRQSLNLEAIKLLLPQEQGGQGPAPQPLSCFGLAGFVQRVRHTSKVNQCLDRLKENLSNEQKLNSELEYMTFCRVMSPLQGAWFTVSAYPHQCDCLAFLNAVFELYGAQDMQNQETASN